MLACLFIHIFANGTIAFILVLAIFYEGEEGIGWGEGGGWWSGAILGPGIFFKEIFPEPQPHHTPPYKNKWSLP